MKKEIINNEEIEVMETEEVAEVETKKGFGSMIKGAIDKVPNGVKTAVKVGGKILLGGLAGYGVYKLVTNDSTGGDCDGCCEDDDEIEYDDVEFEESIEDEEEI